MKVYVVEKGEYEDRMIFAICLSEEKAIHKKQIWDRENAYLGTVVPKSWGGDGVTRYLVDAATITEYEAE